MAVVLRKAMQRNVMLGNGIFPNTKSNDASDHEQRHGLAVKAAHPT